MAAARDEPRNEREGRGWSVYCGLIPAALITLAHFAVSSGSTLATALNPSPTPLPDESLNFTWIV